MKIILEQVIEAIETADEIAMGHLYFSLPIFPVFYSIAFNSGSSIYSDIFGSSVECVGGRFAENQP